MTIVAHNLTFVLALPFVPALPLALPDPRGELQRLVDHLSLEVLPAAGLFRWTEDGPDFTDQVHLGPRDQHFTISINRGARYRGGVCHSEGVSVTAPDGSTRRFGLLISKEALLKLLALLRQRHHAAECDRLRAALRELIAPWTGEPLASAIVPRIGGRIEQSGTQRALLTVVSEPAGTLIRPARRESYLDFVSDLKWTKRYGCYLPLPDLSGLLAGVVAQHNTL